MCSLHISATEFDGGILLSFFESPRMPSTPSLLLSAFCSLLLLLIYLRSAPHLYLFALIVPSGSALEVVVADSRASLAVGQTAASVSQCDVGGS